jgi:uncharacterized protein YjdB
MKLRGSVVLRLSLCAALIASLTACEIFGHLPKSVTVSPVSSTIAKGLTQQLTATVTFLSGDSSTSATVTWSTSAPAVASVSSTGLVTGVGQGTATITATASSLKGSAVITIGPPTLSLAIGPTSPSVAAGHTQQFTATPTMSDGSSPGTPTLSWSSSDNTVATINSSGLASTLKKGTTSIKVTSGSANAQTTLTVSDPVIASIAVTPANPSIAAGATQQFTATATMSDNTTQNVTTTATWASASTATATMDASTKGLAHGVAAGTSTISASLSGITGSTTLAVTGGNLCAGGHGGAGGCWAYVYALSGNTLQSYGMLSDAKLQELGSISTTATTMAMGGPFLQYMQCCLYLGVAGTGAAGHIEAYFIDRASGGLNLIGSSVAMPQGDPSLLAMDPSGKWLFAFDNSASDATVTISVFGVNQATGGVAYTGLSYTYQGALPGKNDFAFHAGSAQNPTFLYFGGFDGSYSNWNQLFAYQVDENTGGLAPLSGSPFHDASPETFSMYLDGTRLYHALDAYQVAIFSVDSLTGIPTYQSTWGQGIGTPLGGMSTGWYGFYAVQGTDLLQINRGSGGLTTIAWTYTNPDYTTDLGLNYSQGWVLIVGDRSGISSFRETSPTPTFINRIPLPSAVIKLVLVGNIT